METTVTFELCRVGEDENDFFIAGSFMSIEGAFNWHLLGKLLFESPDCHRIYSLGKDLEVYKSRIIKLKVWEDSHHDSRYDLMDFEEIKHSIKS